ncbi:mannose-6-phosphate isomerase, class I [Microbacterium telephonicum]|uniref:mannose-6-phosphate isomerase n=1 Tax=Microbacterium telephonicum TaxID=1714841 RepID=A0A498BVF2_9MICO|nr:mannose-6-phosphate isomerase, class I [Microbacterium telephonicum]RLK47744.1 mannose-6-phosphate isomerase type 1 [Microbacterium telephonicum]
MLLALTNTPRDYSWGSAMLIPALQGREPSEVPEAEIWYGDHPGSPARTDDGRTLDAVTADAPLPYLLKILAAGSSLSIQAHPSKDEAVRGFAREEAAGIPRDAAERTYRDDNHKPEIIVALSERFTALVGLRPLDGSRRLVAALGESSGDAPGIRALAAHLQGDDASAALRETLAWLFSGEAAAAIADVEAALPDAAAPGFERELENLRRIAADFPGDPGLVVALLMNLVDLRRGEALFAPAGALHAYQEGLGVELMAASDNVLRGGLTPKHIDAPELLRLVDTTPGPAPRVAAAGTDGVSVYDAGVPDFRLTRVELGDAARTLPVTGPTIVLATAGEVSVAAGAARRTLLPGTAAYVTADESEIVLTGTGEAFVAQPGVSH